MQSLSDRFRRWYEYERNCNAQVLEMLSSVPVDNRADAAFQKAVDRMAHLLSARRIWLFRLGRLPESPRLFPRDTQLADLPGLIAETESLWTAFLQTLRDEELDRVLEWQTTDGRKFRWDLEQILTQLFGHAWYHRGQIAHLVASAGGKAIDTDYIFWSPAAITPAG